MPYNTVADPEICERGRGGWDGVGERSYCAGINSIPPAPLSDPPVHIRNYSSRIVPFRDITIVGV